MKALFLLLFLVNTCLVRAQTSAERNPPPHIKTIKLYRNGDPISLPLIGLNNTGALELHFDDLQGDIKQYFYAYQLCNWDWTPAQLTPFEYIRGFQNVRITNYRVSSLTPQRYTHYQAQLPDRSSVPSRSGNYLLRVFLNGDTSKTVFTRRLVVTADKANIAVRILQPFGAQNFRTAQMLNIIARTDSRLNVLSPQDVKMVVLQNNNWASAIAFDRPTIFRGNYYEYNDEALTTLPGGKEWRWADLRSFRLKSDRMVFLDSKRDTPRVELKTDVSRSGLVYAFYRDINGAFTNEALENINPFWQADYGWVRFSYAPPDGREIAGRNLLLVGEFTAWGLDTSARMQWNETLGQYEKTLLLKQGYYNYAYGVQDVAGGPVDATATEGSFWQTENVYTVLMYFRPFGARSDEVIGTATVSSQFGQPGIR